MDRADDERQELASRRVVVQLDQLPNQLIKVLVALDGDLSDDPVGSVHRLTSFSRLVLSTAHVPQPRSLLAQGSAKGGYLL